ncbi:MAG: glycosyltransferase [Acidithiobacillus sp.]|nr:glycosyltransferase [Acidithiobacillus sp.]
MFVSTSLYEGFGLTALEAAAVGTPVVVTNRGAFPEFLTGVGEIVEPEVEPIAMAISAALVSGKKGRRLLSPQAFSWEMVADKYLSLFNRLRNTTTWLSEGHA